MYSNYKKSPSANAAFVRNHDTEVPFRANQAGSGNDYGEHQDLRHDRRSRRRQITCKTPPVTTKSKVGFAGSGNSNAEFSVFNRELLEDVEYGLEFDTLDCINEKVETLDNINWPALKLAIKSKKPDQKTQNPPKLVDVALQTEKSTLEVKYPLWNTREIALPLEDDIPIFKRNKVSRGTQIEDFMFIKRESSHQSSDEAMMVSPSAAQNQKTYADVVQQETAKLDQGVRSPDLITATETKTFFKIKDTRRNEITEFSQFQDSSTSKIYSENPGIEQWSQKEEINIINADKESQKRNTFSFEELVQCLIETEDTDEPKAAEEEKFGSTRINPDGDYSYQEIGDGDSILKNTNEFSLVENEECPGNLFEQPHLSFDEEREQKYLKDPYYSFDKVMSRAKAEIIATAGFDSHSASDIAHYLWERRKPRLPYTRMFTKSSIEVEAKFETCSQIVDPFPNWTQQAHQGGYQNLSNYDFERQCTSATYESERQVSSRYVIEMHVREMHEQHMPPIMELPGPPAYSNSWGFPYARTENNGLLFSRRN